MSDCANNQHTRCLSALFCPNTKPSPPQPCLVEIELGCSRKANSQNKMGFAMKTAQPAKTPLLATTNLAGLAQQASLLKLGLFGGDGPNQDSEYSFGYDICDRVANLFASCCRHSGDPDHLDDVHTGIGQPGDDREPASVPGQGSD